MSGLAILYLKIGLLATCLGNERIRIDLDGRVFHARNTRECPPGQLWSDDWQEVGALGSAAMTKLRQAIETNGLLASPRETVDDEVEGGWREELELMLDGAAYRFRYQNRDQRAFRATVKLLWGALADVKLASSRFRGVDPMLER